jgi:hypothetical protein
LGYMLHKACYIKTVLSFMFLLIGVLAQSQKNWEGIVYWNYTNINLFNYELLNGQEPRLNFTNKNSHVFVNSTGAWFAGDSIVAYIYPNRKKSSFGGVMRPKGKFVRPDFLDTSFLSNTFPFLSRQRITIRINNQIIIDNALLDQLLAGERIIHKYLQSAKIRDQSLLILRCKLQNHDSVIITTSDLQSGAFLDEYRFYKTDPYPCIIASYDLSEKEQFSQLMRKRDSLQLNSDGNRSLGNSIIVSAIHNDLLLLLKRFTNADTLRIQYRLLRSDNKNDTAWKITENEIPVIQFNNMAKGKKYILQLRYNLTPYIIKEYEINVDIYWWQVGYIQVLIAFIAGILLTGTGWSIYKRRKEKQLVSKEEKRKQLELQLNSVRAQLNPHFIFNAMGTLQTLINRVEIEKANIYLGRVSKLMRSALENSTKLLWGLDDELEYLGNYLEIESLRFNFRYIIEVGEDLPVHEVEIPAMLIQPIVENAIKHGLAGAKNGDLLISIKKDLHDMIVCIKDNGPGFKDHVHHRRFGLHLTFERIKLLNQILPARQIRFDINSLPGPTQCIFKFENWL